MLRYNGSEEHQETPGIVMLPAFDHHGNLPAGIHRCTVEELATRFARGSEERTTEFDELLRFIEAAKLAGVRRLMVNGSFVTSKSAPNDVDVVFLPGPGYPRQGLKLESDELLWPFLQVIVAADEADFESWATGLFATDRENCPKGVVEVIL